MRNIKNKKHIIIIILAIIIIIPLWFRFLIVYNMKNIIQRSIDIESINKVIIENDTITTVSDKNKIDEILSNIYSLDVRRTLIKKIDNSDTSKNIYSITIVDDNSSETLTFRNWKYIHISNYKKNIYQTYTLVNDPDNSYINKLINYTD